MLDKIKQSKYIAVDTETYPAEDFDNYYNYMYNQLLTNNAKISKTKLKTFENSMQAWRKEGALNTLTNQVRLLQLATEDKEIFVIDRLETPEVFNQVLTELIEGDHLLVMHNGKFDLKSLYKYNNNVFKQAKVIDTFILQKLYHHENYSEIQPANLGATLLEHLDIDLPKDQGNARWDKHLTDEMLEYAANDVRFLIDLANTLINKIQAKQIIKLECALVNVFAEMEFNGIAINTESLEAQVLTTKDRVNELQALFTEKNLNPNSPKQLLEWTKNYNYNLTNTSAKTLREKAIRCPLIKEVLEFKETTKLNSMIEGYIEKIEPSTTRLHASINQLGTHTGRTSSSNPNIQQIPRPIKKSLYKVNEGKAIVKIDYSAAQLRIASIIMNEKRMQDAFKLNQDIHKKTASLIYNVKLDEVTKEQRQTAKAINFGLIFGMSAGTLLEYVKGYGVQLSPSEASRFREAYFRSYPAVADFHKANSDKLEIVPSFQVKTLLGRNLKVNRYTNANNYATQGTEADMVKLSMLNWYKNNTTPSAKLINMVHDELIFEVDSQEINILIVEIARIMEQSCTILGISYPEPTEVEVLR